MFEFNDEFWESINASDFTPSQKRKFEEKVRNETEVRVGRELSKGLSKAQVEEFETIIEGAEGYCADWLNENHPEHRDSKLYAILEKQGFVGDALINELACVFWLESNRPDYKQIVKMCSEELRREIMLMF